MRARARVRVRVRVRMDTEVGVEMMRMAKQTRAGEEGEDTGERTTTMMNEWCARGQGENRVSERIE